MKTQWSGLYNLEDPNVMRTCRVPGISPEELRREMAMKHLKSIQAFREEVEKAGPKHYKEYFESRRGKSLLKSSETLRAWARRLQRRVRCYDEDY